MNEKWDKLYEKWFTGNEHTKEEIEKYFEEGTGIPVSFHWEDVGGGRKKGVLTPIKKNIKILTDLEKVLGNGQPVNFEIKGPDGELKKENREEFAEWMTERKEEKNIKSPPKESLVCGASGDIDGTTVFIERKGKDGVIRESYYQPRSGEKKKQIIEKNQKRREKSQVADSPIQNKEDKPTEKENSQQNPSQNSENKSTGTEKSIKPDRNQELSKVKNNKLSTGLIVGGGIMSVAVVVLIATVGIRLKGKKRK